MHTDVLPTWSTGMTVAWRERTNDNGEEGDGEALLKVCERAPRTTICMFAE